MIKATAKIWRLVSKIVTRLKMFCFRRLFKSTGRNLIFTPSDVFSFSAISIGDDVFIGPGAHFSSLKGIEIRDRVMFGPNVTMLGGNHNSELNGTAMRFNEEKRESDDEAIVVEEDSWIGAGATILKGVTVGRGAIVAAQAVVTKDVASYTIVAGCPAKLIRARGAKQQVQSHESGLYDVSDCMSLSQLAHLPDEQRKS